MMNQDIRDQIRRCRLYNSDVAEQLGISNSTLYYRLSRKLTVQQRCEFLDAINRAAEIREAELDRLRSGSEQ